MTTDKPKIVIIEDDYALSKLIQLKLESTGFETYCLFSGNEALQFIPDHPEYFVLLDYKLDDMLGKNIIQELYANSIKFPFVMMTGYGDQNLAVEMMKLGAYDYLVKEFHFVDQLPAILLKAINLYDSNKKLEESRKIIAKNEERYRDIFNNIHDIYIVISDDYTIEEISPSFDIVFNTNKENMVGLNIWKLFVLKDEWSYFENKLLENGSIINMEVLLSFDKERLEKNCLIDAKRIYSETECKHKIIGTIRDITEYKRLENEIIVKVIQAEAKERKSIADNLHDDVGPLLSAIKIYVNMLSDANNNSVTCNERKHLIENISSISDETIKNIRNIVNSLTPNILSDYGLEKAFLSFCNKLLHDDCVNIEFTACLLQDWFGQVLESVIYRSGVEMINNGLKHSKANHIQLKLEQNGENLWLKYSDNGIGFNIDEQLNPETTSGHGVLNIIHMVKSLHGKIQINSILNKGTNIEILFILSNILDV